MNQRLHGFIHQIGVLRVALGVVVLASVILRAEPGAQAVYEGWEMVPNLLLPALVPIIFMGVMLDMLMSRVMMSDKQGLARARYRTILKVDLGMALAILGSWLPFFVTLGE